MLSRCSHGVAQPPVAHVDSDERATARCRYGIEQAHVGGGIETSSGDITIGANSRVEGGVLVNEDHSWFHVSTHKPHIVIGPHATVQGTLQFKREVELYVSDSATIGKVEGATPHKFSGDQPQD